LWELPVGLHGLPEFDLDLARLVGRLQKKGALCRINCAVVSRCVMREPSPVQYGAGTSPSQHILRDTVEDTDGRY
jgi:hypothetical protein